MLVRVKRPAMGRRVRRAVTHRPPLLIRRRAAAMTHRTPMTRQTLMTHPAAMTHRPPHPPHPPQIPAHRKARLMMNRARKRRRNQEVKSETCTMHIYHPNIGLG